MKQRKADSAGKQRDAIAAVARDLFGREGYTRASMDRIAADAGMSTRTIYNNFPSKAKLFDYVLRESATQVSDTLDAKIAALEGGGLEEQLFALGMALVSQETDFAEHFRMVRQIVPEAHRVPPRTLAAWRDAGPRRRTQAVADRLVLIGRDGGLEIEDPRRAATHFIALTTSWVIETVYDASLADPDVVVVSVGEAVRVFVNGYAAKHTAGRPKRRAAATA
ncbi:MAG TPA: TetR/AcrR family transcriptional regulator [Solirubrobacteraceae bacterium]|nr:TetR/AcrR family transcriptional regulator [Solirubrobacteraceae bacterium]